MKNSFFWIGGYHSVNAALENNNRVIKQIVSAKPIKISKNFEVKIKSKRFIDSLFKKYPNFNHQNIAAEISEFEKLELKEEVKKINNLIILNGITDVGNIGAIMRSALAFGFDGIIINKRQIDLKNPAIYKTSSGAIENLKIFITSNINNSLNFLKKNEFWSYAIDLNGNQYLDNLESACAKNVIILGSENEGISKIILDNSDTILKIKMTNNVESLNVASAASVVLSKFFSLKNKY